MSRLVLGWVRKAEGNAADRDSKESRAEQNRKAQQVFRRKREEKMKQLEIDAMALAGTRARLQAAEERILSLALVSPACCPRRPR